MLTEEALQQLHARASLGERISPEENAALEDWYCKHDAEEFAAWAAEPLPDIAGLRERVNVTLTRIATLALRMRRMNEENDRLRKEIAALHEQLAENRRSEPA